jgi:hypothetical protein
LACSRHVLWSSPDCAAHSATDGERREKTAFAKLAREQKLRERRQEKQAKKSARKRAAEMDLAQVRDGTPAGGDR